MNADARTSNSKSLRQRLYELWQAFLFLLICAAVLAGIAGIWYLDHVRFLWR